MKEDTLQVQVARIDVNVQHIKESLPGMRAKINRHEKELLIGKVLLVVITFIGAIKFPQIADAITLWIKS